jgi:phosphoribosylformylglycinamidine cyclo-ligase
VEGIVRGCETAECILIGGETAELPDFYRHGEYDLAGFCVGMVEHDNIIDGKNVREGDVLLGLASSGIHSNGFSLVNRIIKSRKLDLEQIYNGFYEPLKHILLTETRIYAKSILSLLETGIQVPAMAHITGGGIEGNVIRVIPEGLGAVVRKSSIPQQNVFSFIQGTDVSEEEMYKVFNMGAGFVLILHSQDVNTAMKHLSDAGENPFIMGEVIKTDKGIIFP